jgi:hypothetical protein
MFDLDKKILVAIFGISTTLLTGITLGLIQVYTGHALYSFTFWFVIPVGAMLSGFGAASGYYFGAKLFHQKPSGGVLLNMVASSITAFLVVHYIPYYMLEVDGVRVNEVISFWQYIDIAIKHTSLSFIRIKASTGELGAFWGYAYACLKLIGFSIGGIAVFLWLSKYPYCDKCSRYLQKTGQQDRFTLGGDLFVNQIKEFYLLLDNLKFNEAIKIHSEQMGVNKGSGYQLKSMIITRRCPVCGKNHLDFIVSKLDSNDWKDIDETARRAFTEEQLTILSN